MILNKGWILKSYHNKIKCKIFIIINMSKILVLMIILKMYRINLMMIKNNKLKFYMIS